MECTNNNADYLLTVPEVANLLKTTKKAVYTMFERRLIPGAVKIGKRLLFKKNIVLRWIDGCSPYPEGDNHER
jgi:excisionase family DNA binding protein